MRIQKKENVHEKKILLLLLVVGVFVYRAEADQTVRYGTVDTPTIIAVTFIAK